MKKIIQMKRPLMTGLLCYLGGLLYHMFVPYQRILPVFFLLLLVFEIVLFCSKETRLVCYLVPLGFLAGLFVYGRTKPPDMGELFFEDYDSVIAEGDIEWIEEKNGTFRIRLSDASLYFEKNNSNNEKILVSLKESDSNLNLYPGIHARVWGSVYHFKEARNPGEFDLKKYYESKQISCGVYADGISVTSWETGVGNKALWNIRKKFAKAFDDIAPQNASAILKTMLLGDASDLEAEVKESYQLSGISHLLCISGIHISMIGVAFWICFRYILPSVRMASVLSMLMIVCYGKMTGMGTAAHRAVIMFLLMMAAWTLGRTYDMPTALSISAAVILSENPLLIGNAGALLSFFAILGILCVLPMWDIEEEDAGLKDKKSLKKRLIRHVMTVCAENFWTGISINLATLPIVLYFYYQIPTYSIFLNILILPTVPWLLADGIVSGIAGIVSVSLGRMLIFPAVKLLQFYEMLMEAVKKLPEPVLIIGKPPVWQMLAYYMLLFFVAGCVRACRAYFNEKESKGKSNQGERSGKK